MEQYLNIIRNFKNQKILVVGDIMLDEYVWGDVNRISPEAPIPILDVKKIEYVPGGVANVAHNIKSLGDEVTLVGVIGPEDKGKILKEILGKKGINTDGIIIDEKRRTTVKTRAVAKNQQLVRIDFEDRDSINPEIEAKISDFIEEKIKEVNAVIISDYAKGVITSNLSQNIIMKAKENNVLCLVDPKGDDYSKYRGCNIITPNKKELAQCLNIQINQINNESRFLQAGKMLLSHVMSDNVLVTRGQEGMTLFEKSGETFHHPAVNKRAVDVSGAGDTSIATLTLSLTAGADPKQAITIASYACGVAIDKVGTAVVSPEELEEILKNIYLNNEKN